MRKHMILPLLTIFLGIMGFFRRRWHLDTALDSATELFYPGNEATYEMVSFTILVLVSLLLICYSAKNRGSYEDTFYAPTPVYITLMVIAAALFLIAAAVNGLEARYLYLLWEADAKRNLFPAAKIVSALLCIPAAGGVLALGKGNYRNSLNDYHPVLTTLPAFSALAWLVFIYQDYSRDPQPLRYAWTLFAVIFVVLALYFACAFAYDRPNPAAALFFSLGGIFFSLISLADKHTRGSALMAAAQAVLLLAGCIPLLHSQFGPKWPRRLERMPHRGDMEEESAHSELNDLEENEA